MTEVKEKKHKKRDKRSLIAVIIIAVAIVFATLLITVFLVDDFNSLGDLFSFIGKQF